MLQTRTASLVKPVKIQYSKPAGKFIALPVFMLDEAQDACGKLRS